MKIFGYNYDYNDWNHIPHSTCNINQKKKKYDDDDCWSSFTL